MRGAEQLVLKNQRRAERLLEEIHTIKKLKPDDVTKTALRKEINFDKVFNKANSTVETRAVARLATHPLLKQKISAIKDAINAFKEARINHAEDDAKPEPPSLPSKPAQNVNREAENKPKLVKAKPKRKTEETKLENEVMDSHVIETIDKETDLLASNHNNEEPCSPSTPQAPALQAAPEVPAEKNILLSSSEKEIVQNKLEKKLEQQVPDQKVPSASESDSSDLEDSHNEDKEYFDDSTEERFLKQSSGFEDSDSDGEDDFFIGKVRQTRKKKSSKNNDQVKKDKFPSANVKPTVSGVEEQKASTGFKNVKLESVFCTSLAETKLKSPYMKRDSNLPHVRNKKPVFPQASTLSRKPQAVKASAVKQSYKSKVQEQTLHPSWEASRKLKEQSQIAVFQGKRIVFDD
ncbi:serum response factor-binding protein 1 isoform X2 [Rhinoderma darwinii]|uniref:serum response factor-binding protein 1 isoform X2 n=1 Tax=Rhinoderma darwinii TaxID=43563 RepID=UPI003F678CC3